MLKQCGGLILVVIMIIVLVCVYQNVKTPYNTWICFAILAVVIFGLCCCWNQKNYDNFIGDITPKVIPDVPAGADKNALNYTDLLKDESLNSDEYVTLKYTPTKDKDDDAFDKPMLPGNKTEQDEYNGLNKMIKGNDWGDAAVIQPKVKNPNLLIGVADTLMMPIVQNIRHGSRDMFRPQPQIKKNECFFPINYSSKDETPKQRSLNQPTSSNVGDVSGVDSTASNHSNIKE